MKGEAITILLVEDDPAHAEIVRRGEFPEGLRRRGMGAAQDPR